MQIGSKYHGSSSVLTSKGKDELVPEKTLFYKLSFAPEQDCRVRINGSKPIMIRPSTGFSMNEIDKYISSFIIEDSGIDYTWIGGSQ